MAPASDTADHVLSFDSLSDAELRAAILRIADAHATAAESADKSDDPPLVRIDGAAGQDAAMNAIRSQIRLHVTGSLGDYALAFCSRCDVRIDGAGGHGVAECLEGAGVRFRGDVGCGAGVAMISGTLAVYGSAGDRTGAAMRGGEIFVRGDAGDDVGAGMWGGTLVIGGDAGERLGDARGRGTIFIRGKARSLAEGMVEVSLRKRDELRLGMLLINASIRGAAKEFRRVISETEFKREQQQLTGETRPSWR